jgi:ParB-like chromosome segregation protein Spo0J
MAIQLTFDGMAPSISARLTVDYISAADLAYHDLANLFPLIEGAEFEALKADIAQHGVLEPIWLYEGKLLEGRNRYRACQELGIDCPRRGYDGDDPVGFVVSLNLRRRHLDESQRGAIAARLSRLTRGRPGENVGISTFTQTEAAELLNVSRDTVIQARKVQQNGAPEVVKSVDAGEITVSAAQEIIGLPKDQQVAILEEARHAANGKPLTATRLRETVKQQGSSMTANTHDEGRTQEAIEADEHYTRTVSALRLTLAASLPALVTDCGNLLPRLTHTDRDALVAALPDSLAAFHRLQAMLVPPPEPVPPEPSRDTEPRTSGTRTQAVLEIANELKKFTCPTITARLGVTPKAVNQALKGLVKQGKLKQRGQRQKAVFTYVGSSEGRRPGEMHVGTRGK